MKLSLAIIHAVVKQQLYYRVHRSHAVINSQCTIVFLRIVHAMTHVSKKTFKVPESVEQDFLQL